VDIFLAFTLVGPVQAPAAHLFGIFFLFCILETCLGQSVAEIFLAFTLVGPVQAPAAHLSLK
jgi:hypothetical protein